jgi:hypothetical protein
LNFTTKYKIFQKNLSKGIDKDIYIVYNKNILKKGSDKMAKIEARTIKTVRQNFKEVEEILSKDKFAAVWITKRGENCAVMITPEAYCEYRDFKISNS